MKKLFSLILVLSMLMMCMLPACALELNPVYPYAEELQINPGNPRADKPEYSYAWLDNIVVRYDPNSVTSAVITPKPDDYLYSDTYDEFIEEVNNYSKLFALNEDTVTAVYQDITSALFYGFTVMGFTDSQENMRRYLVDYGISLPVNEGVEDKAAIAVIYAALKYDALYVLYEKKVSIPVGSTLDEALVIVLSALTGTMLPSGIDSLAGLAVLVMENYITDFDQLPISEDPDAAEVFHWAKVITAAKNEYKVPLDSYDLTTKAQREYVDYAYYASIINTLYDIQVDPIRLVLAMQSKEENSLQKFILKTMLESKEVSYGDTATCEELFVLACQNGFFALEDEFYTDIFFYDITVPASCEKIWFTPFALASQLDGGNDAYVSIFLNDVQMSPNSTVSTPVDTAKAEETVKLRVVYDDKTGNPDEVVYSFRLIKDKTLDEKKEEVSEGDIVGQVGQFIDTIVPDGNSAANEKVDEVMGAIDSAVSQAASQLGEDILTTYGTDSDVISGGITGYDITTSASDPSGFDFKYLEELMSGVYATDADGNIITTTALAGIDDADGLQESIITRVTESVKESPEIVAVPSSLLAAFSFVGYFINKKHRGNEAFINEDEEESDDE